MDPELTALRPLKKNASLTAFNFVLVTCENLGNLIPSIGLHASFPFGFRNKFQITGIIENIRP